jgi:hypothetical protein
MSSAQPKIESPCVLICSIDDKTGLCFGCGRTRDEIALWGSMTHETRSDIMGELDSRLSKVERPARRVTKRRAMRQNAD